ncbi:hypothetical protein MXB_1815, partial [Myxobolus squamalis]
FIIKSTLEPVISVCWKSTKAILPEPPTLFKRQFEDRVMVLRSKGGNKRLIMLSASSAYCLWATQKLSKLLKIMEVDMIPPTYKFVKPNYLNRYKIGVDKSIQNQFNDGFVYAKICICPFDEGYLLTRMLEGSELESYLKLSHDEKWVGRYIIPVHSPVKVGSLF